MPRIVFRGKTYYSVYEMPPNIRRAYEKEKKKAQVEPTEEAGQTTDPSLYDPKTGTESIMRGLVWGILVALLLSGIAFLLARFLF